MKLYRRPITACLVPIAAVFALGCEAPVSTGPTVGDPIAPQMVISDADRLADLGMARIKDLRIRRSGGRRLLAFSVTIVNVGAGTFELHGRRASSSEEHMSVVQRIYDSSDGWRDVATDAVMELGGDGHDHWHVHDLERMELIRLDNGGRAGASAKSGYCFWDNVAYRRSLPGAPGSEVYQESGCGDAVSLTTAMGLSIGWGDIYPYWLPDQNIDITGLGSGRYRLLVTADPFGWFTESNESNNTTWVDLQLRSNGKLRVIAYGPTA